MSKINRPQNGFRPVRPQPFEEFRPVRPGGQKPNRPHRPPNATDCFEVKPVRHPPIRFPDGGNDVRPTR